MKFSKLIISILSIVNLLSCIERTNLQLAKDAINDYDIARAADILEQVLIENKSDCEAYKLYIDCLFSLNRHHECLAMIDSASKWCAAQSELLQKLEGTKLLIESPLFSNSDFMELSKIRDTGSYYESIGQFDSAYVMRRRFIERDSSNCVGYSDLANLFQVVMQPDSALIYHSRALSKCPDNYLLYFNRATALARARSYTDAIHDYKHALLLNANCCDCLADLAYVYEELGEKDSSAIYHSLFREFQCDLAK